MSIDPCIGPAPFISEPIIPLQPNRAVPRAQRISPSQNEFIPYIAKVSADLITVAIVGLLAIRIQSSTHLQIANGVVALPDMMHSHSMIFGVYILWFALCLVFFMKTGGLYVQTISHSGLKDQRKMLQATLTAGLVLCSTAYLSRSEVMSRQTLCAVVLGAGVLLSIRRALWRCMAYRRCRQDIDTRNVLIVGTGDVAQQLRIHLESQRHLGVRFKGFVSLPEHEDKNKHTDVIGSFDNCLVLAKALFVDEIFISAPTDREQVIDFVDRARHMEIDVRIVPDLYKGLEGDPALELVGAIPTLRLYSNELDLGSALVKRMLDVSMASMAILVLCPLLLIITIAIRLGSAGPILYQSRRIGRKGRIFTLYKFRTMVANADELRSKLEERNERDYIFFKIRDDPRVTRLGAFLRKYSLDEVPQLLNVLIGDMSLVGPRPPVPSEVEQYELSHLKRLEVLPGITGLWQIEGRTDLTFESYISLDMSYVENWSIWLDLKILLRTIKVVTQGTGT